MKLPSVEYILEGFRRSARRFPAALCAAVCAYAAACVMVANSGRMEDWDKFLMPLSLGVALFYGLALMNERPPLPRAVKPGYVTLAGLAFLVCFFYYLTGSNDLGYQIRYTHWLFIVALFILVAPWLAAPQVNGFWQFDKRILLRAAVSAFYTVVLFMGLSLALAAVHKLLGVKIDDKVYQYLWLFGVCLFWPLHLFGGTPRDYEGLEADTTYPGGLKLFTQYVLIPLATVYYLILYAYMIKILVTQQWPQGWVSWLTSSASVLGLVTFLLLYPVRDLEGNRWMKLYSRGFCLAAMPLLLMLFTAVFKRVAQYGITEHRYFLIALAAWLAGMFAYFIFSRRPDIRRVPVSLAALALLVSFGPWGAYSVSLSSQLNRLESAFRQNGLLVSGKVVKLDHELDAETRAQLSASLDYVVLYHGISPLKKYFTQDLASLAADKPHRYVNGVSRELMKYMGQTYLRKWERGESEYVSFFAENRALDVRDFDLAVKFTAYSSVRPAGRRAGEALGDDYSAELTGKARTLRVLKGGALVIEVRLDKLYGELAGKAGKTRGGALPQSLMTAEAGNAAVKVKVYFENLGGSRKPGEGLNLTQGDGLLLIKNKRRQ